MPTTISESLVRAQGELRLLRVDAIGPNHIVVASQFRLTGPSGFSSEVFASFALAYAAFRQAVLRCGEADEKRLNDPGDSVVAE